MKPNPLGRFLGLTRNELLILLSMGGVLVCVLMAFEAYVLHTASQAVPPATRTGFPGLQLTDTPEPYVPAPSVTGSAPAGMPTADPRLAPTRTPRPTKTPAPTRTPRPTRTPTVTATATRPTPTATVQLGTAGNPIPMRSGFTFPGLGTLTVLRSTWAPGQAGHAVVDLYFVCGRPTGDRCDTGKLLLDVLGGSGNGYEREFSTSIPEPPFGYTLDSHLFGGQAERANAGFLIDDNESKVMMRVRVFLEQGEFYFWIGPTSAD